MAECNADQPLKFDPDVVDFVLEFGPSICATVEECRATLSSVGTTKITPAAVARIMNGMIKASERNQDNALGTGIWGEPTKSEGEGSWNGKVFVQAVLELVPTFVWKEVFHQLDFQGFFVKNTHSFRSLIEALRYGLQLQGQTRPDQFPVEAFYRTWNNVEGQVSLIKCCLSPSNYDIFCFADLPLHACNVEILKTSADKSYDLKEIHTWKSLQLLELLLSFGERGQYQAAQELFQFPTVHCPDILLLGLTQLNTPMTTLRQELMTTLFPIFLGNHVSSGVILQYAWHSGPNSVRPIMILAMADWYLKGDYDQAKLSRILDVAQDLKALPLLLNANNPPFIIDLACLASRREFLKLDKWLTDKIREHGEAFVASLVSVVRRRVPQILGRDENVPKSAQLPAEVVNTIIQCLHQCVGKVSPELADSIMSLVSTYNMLMNKARPPPTNNTPQPGVLRTHRSIDPGFNVASPTLFPQTPTDPFSALGSTLAGLNLAGVGGGFGGGGMNQLGPTPGSPSRLLGPSFSSQSGSGGGFPGLHGLQLGPPNPGPGRNASTPPMGQNPNMGMLSGRLANPLGGPGPGGPGLGSLLPLSGSGGEPRRHVPPGVGDDTRLFNEIQPNEISKEAEDEANSYFHRIYSKAPDPTMSIDEVLDLLKRFQDSAVRREREVFTCMLRNLFEEYKFFPQYPEKELHTTAQLFGGIIEHGLVTTYLQLGVALRFVVDALKKPPGTKMYYFGTAALDRFKTKLKDYPQYCQHLSTIPHYQEFPAPLLEYIDYGSRQLEPPRSINSNRPGASALPPAAASSSLNSMSILTHPPTAASAPGQGKPVGSVSASAISKPSSSHSGPSITGRPSIANATNINTLLVATEKDDKIVTPPEIIMDKTAFIFNNLNQMNLADKCKELKEILGTDYWAWIAQYLVMKRASIELNFHTLYSNLLDTIKTKELYDAVLKETHRNIKILLRADKSASNFSDRSLLKNLGHWLGLITLMRNKPIILDDLDIKSLIIEAYRKGLQDLLYVVPFAAKIIEACARSTVFKPPCPWTMAILNVLAELHREPDMKLNLKFEIEVLCKALSLEVMDLKPSSILKDESAFKVMIRQLPYPDANKTEAKARPQPNPLPEPAQSKPAETTTQKPSTVTPQPEEIPSGSAPGPIPASSSSSSTNAMQNQQSIGGPVIGGLATTPLATTGAAQEPKFSYMEVDTSNLPGLLAHVVVNAQLPLFQTHPTLKQFVRPAVDKAIQDLLHPVVDRSIKYTVNACESIIKKDFALDPEDNRIRLGAHHMMRYLTAGMAMITSRDHIFIAISGNLKHTFSEAVRPGAGSQNIKEMVDQAATVIAQENMELACVFIQKTAVEKALLEIDKRLSSEYDARRIAKMEGRRYVDPIMLGYQMDRMPEQVRIKATGAVSQQLAVYEDFSRNIPGFIPPTEGEVPFFKPNFNPRLELPPSTQPLGITSLPQTGPAPPSANEDLIAIYDKLIGQMESYAQDLSLSPTNVAAQLVRLNGIRLLLEMISNAKQSRSVVTAISLLQKSVEGLLEAVALFPGDTEMIRFRDAHLMILKALQDSRAFGEQWVNRQVTKTLIEARADLKYNVEAVDTLIRANLVHMPQFDSYLANALEKGNNLAAMAFAIPLIRLHCVDDRYAVGVNDGDLYNTVDALCLIAATSRSPPEGLLVLVEALRGNANNSHAPPPSDTNVNAGVFGTDRPVSTVSTLHSGFNLTREHDDPSGLVEKSELLLREWIRLYLTQGTPKDSNKAFTSFINELNISGILKSDDVITRFFRISVQCCVNQVYQGLQAGSLAMVRGKVYQSTDALVRLVALLVRHIGESASPTPKVNLLNKFLGIVAGLLIQDHDMQKSDFQQLPFHRLFIMLFYDLNVSDPIYETIAMQTLTGFSNTLHILCPAKVPGFAYAWLEIVGNRMFIARMLALAADQKCWAMYCQLLLDLFKFLQPFMRNADMAPSVQTLYRGTLRVLLVILHDFPDFLCDYCYHFLDNIPPNCIQMRNLVLSAFPRNMRLPDPFTANLKFEMLPDTSLPPRILSNVGAMITPASFKADLDSYLKTRAPVTFLSELRTSLQVPFSESGGNRYNIPLLNALVLFCGSQHITVIRARGQTPNMSTVAHSSHMDIFQNLAVDLDTEGRYLFLNSLANQLRFPSSHTHYFSLVILYLFAQSNTEVVQEQITRVLLERLVVNRPHPWGLLVTFIELIKNPMYKFWSHEFVHCAPEVEKLFESVARSCMVTKTPAPNALPQAPQQQQQVMHLGQANGPMLFNASADASSVLDPD